MPELPDVEVYRRRLDRGVLNKTIRKVSVSDSRILDGVNAATLARRLKGRRFVDTRRHGKHLLVRLDKGGWVHFHFGMTGAVHHIRDGDRPLPYTRVRFDFSDGDHLAYTSKRLLGRVGLTADADAFVAEHALGPDALDSEMDLAAFRKALSGTTRAVKAALMDQEALAGIGNVYSDEILFHARIDPRTPATKLDAAKMRRLHRTMRRVLETAVERGAGSDDFIDRVPRGWLLPHRHKDGRCPRSHGALATYKIGGRTSYFCPRCQR